MGMKIKRRGRAW